MVNRENALWTARQLRCLAEATGREADRLLRHADGAAPGLLDGVRMLQMAADELAERSRRVQHRLEAELPREAA
jgi:hypothetical protein